MSIIPLVIFAGAYESDLQNTNIIVTDMFLKRNGTVIFWTSK